jgi:hypothetical protein
MKQILFLGASPRPAAQLAVADEAREIRSRVERDAPDAFRIFHETDVAGRHIVPLMDYYTPTVLHLSGHGSSGGDLLLEDSLLSPALLARIADAASSNRTEAVELVVINACHSSAAAPTLLRAVPIIIGMSREISDDAALEFSAQLYAGLGKGRSVLSAFQLASAHIEALNGEYAGVPQLHERFPGAAQRMVLRVAPPEIRAKLNLDDEGRPLETGEFDGESTYSVTLYIHSPPIETQLVTYRLHEDYDEYGDGLYQEVSSGNSTRFSLEVQAEADFLVRAVAWTSRDGHTMQNHIGTALKRHYASLSTKQRREMDTKSVDVVVDRLAST